MSKSITAEAADTILGVLDTHIDTLKESKSIEELQKLFDARREISQFASEGGDEPKKTRRSTSGRKRGLPAATDDERGAGAES